MYYHACHISSLWYLIDSNCRNCIICFRCNQIIRLKSIINVKYAPRELLWGQYFYCCFNFAISSSSALFKSASAFADKLHSYTLRFLLKLCLSNLHFKSVTHTPYSLNILRLRCVELNLFSYLLDVYSNCRYITN